MATTAKVHLTQMVETGEGDERVAQLRFTPDYNDGRNKEWAVFTPTLDLTMQVRRGACDNFTAGKNYILTFEEAQD